VIGLVLVTWMAAAALATEPVPVPVPVPDLPAATDAQTSEDARVTQLLVQLNQTLVAYLEQGLALVDQTERHCTPSWAADLIRVRGEWDTASAALLLELNRPGGRWARLPSDAASIAAQAELEDPLDQAEAAFMERVRLMNQLMTRCPEHKKALQGIYALGKTSFIVG